MVVEGSTTLSPKDLLWCLKVIETQIGREKTFRYGPRVIDLGILFYGDVIINTTDLQIPHPKIQERGFVLVPLCEIAQDYLHPVLNKTIQDLLAQIDHVGIIRLYTKEDINQ